jgi:hypothetical protein
MPFQVKDKKLEGGADFLEGGAAFTDVRVKVILLRQ